MAGQTSDAPLPTTLSAKCCLQSVGPILWATNCPVCQKVSEPGSEACWFNVWKTAASTSVHSHGKVFVRTSDDLPDTFRPLFSEIGSAANLQNC